MGSCHSITSAVPTSTTTAKAAAMPEQSSPVSADTVEVTLKKNRPGCNGMFCREVSTALALLPSDLKKQVASFLSAKDTHSLNQTSSSVHADLCFSTLSPAFQLYSSSIWHGERLTGDRPVCGAKIPIFFGSSSIHSINLTCLWRDQGWGNRKGRLFVLGFPDSENHDHTHTNLRFSDGRLTYRTQIAPHTEERLKFSFKPRRNEIYYIWYIVGGGGGHDLRLRNLIVHTAVFDDQDRTFSKTFQALSNKGIFYQPQNSGFNNGLAVIASLKSAISRNEAPDLILSQFLASNNIDVHEATLAAMEELVQYVHQSRPVEDTGNERVERSSSTIWSESDDSNSDFLMDDSNSDTTDDGSVDHNDDPF